MTVTDPFSRMSTISGRSASSPPRACPSWLVAPQVQFLHHGCEQAGAASPLQGGLGRPLHGRGQGAEDRCWRGWKSLRKEIPEATLALRGRRLEM